MAAPSSCHARQFDRATRASGTVLVWSDLVTPRLVGPWLSWSGKGVGGVIAVAVVVVVVAVRGRGPCLDAVVGRVGQSWEGSGGVESGRDGSADRGGVLVVCCMSLGGGSRLAEADGRTVGVGRWSWRFGWAVETGHVGRE